jgi:hypothetical protein
MHVSQTEPTRAWKVENVMVLAPIQQDAEGLIHKDALLEGELAEARQAQEVAKDTFCSLSKASANGAWCLVVSDMECRKQFEELSLLCAWGAEFSFTIIGPSQVRIPLLARMQFTTLRDTEMAGELTVLRAAVSSTVDLVLGRSPGETSQVEVVNELVAKFQRLEELSSRLEGFGAWIYTLLVGPPTRQARWADHLDEATRWLEVEMAKQHQVVTEQEALRTLAALARDLVLDDVNGPSSLAASLSMMVELLEGQIDTVAANRFHWRSRSTLVAALSHFPELKSGLELHGSRQNADLIDDQAMPSGLW